MSEKKPFDPKVMDDAAIEAGRDWEALKEKYPEATKEVSDFLNKWVSNAGWKRLGKVIAGRWG